MFHQLEGFAVDEKVTMVDLRSLLEEFLAMFFETNNLKLRFRPSFFPFTEPSAEVDVNYGLNSGIIKIGEGDSFLEILGCGMIHPKVLENCQVDTKKFRGLAFGVGIERLAMLKYGISDLRMLFEGDVRFLNHYR
jgi:phenylalanyl-tRNA synthetase alpha chain